MKKIILLFILSFCASHLMGQSVFQKTYGGVNSDWGSAAIPLNDDTYIIGGHTNNFGAGNYDAYLVKINSNGDTLWTKTYGGVQNDFVNEVKRTADEGYIMVGTTASTTSGGTDIYLLKTDSSGNLQWAQCYGDVEDEEGNAVRQTQDGGYVIAGNSLSFSSGVDIDALLIRTNSNGDTLWTRAFGGFGDEFGNAVLQDQNGSFILAGTTSSFGVGAYDIFLIRMSAAGLFISSRTYGTFGLEYTYTLEQRTGGYIIAGLTSTFSAGDVDVMLVSLDTLGNIVWSTSYGGANSDVANAVTQTADGGYIVAGYTQSFGAGASDYYLVKTNSNGSMLWSKAYGGTNLDESNSVSQTTDGGYIISGFSHNFGQGLSDIYTLKTDSNGYSGCNEMTPATQVTNSPLTAQSFGTPIFSGCTVLTFSPTIGAGSQPLTVCVITAADERAGAQNAFDIYPNPASKELIIEGLKSKIECIEIYNAIGKRVDLPPALSFETNTKIDISSLNAGLYFLQVTGERKIYSYKFLKQ